MAEAQGVARGTLREGVGVARAGLLLPLALRCGEREALAGGEGEGVMLAGSEGAAARVSVAGSDCVGEEVAQALALPSAAAGVRVPGAALCVAPLARLALAEGERLPRCSAGEAV